MDEHILEGLFKWSHEFIIRDAFGEEATDEDGKLIVLYQRIIGDAELDMARSTALRASALKRRQLADPTSLDRMTLIPDFSKLDKETLISLIVLYELPEIRADTARQLIFPFPELPKNDASLEEQEAYQGAVDTYFEKREEKLQEEVNELIKIRRKSLERENKGRLKFLYEEVAIESACREIFLGTINEMMTYLGTFVDSNFNDKLFSSFYGFRNAATELKLQLIEQYAQLQLSGEKLKK